MIENNTIYLIKWSESYSRELDSKKLLCTNDERDYGGKFKKINDKTAYLLGRSYIRQFCSEILEISPSLLPISKDVYGRPFLENYANKLDFNISHSDSMLAIGVSTVGKIGVDLEKIKPLDLHEIETFLTEDETFYIKKSDSLKLEILFQTWTSIEAYSKLLGVGLDSQIKNRNFVPINKNQVQIINNRKPIYISSYKFDQYMLSIAKEKSEIEFKIIKLFLA